jgi:hypothetical protein
MAVAAVHAMSVEQYVGRAICWQSNRSNNGD